MIPLFLSTGQAGAEVGVGVGTTCIKGMSVRRLMPIECERLQGFPDNHTRILSWNGWRKIAEDETPESCREKGLQIKQTKSGKWRVKDVDSPRYKAIGNSWAVNCAEWIGERIQMMETTP